MCSGVELSFQSARSCKPDSLALAGKNPRIAHADGVFATWLVVIAAFAHAYERWTVCMTQHAQDMPSSSCVSAAQRLLGGYFSDEKSNAWPDEG